MEGCEKCMPGLKAGKAFGGAACDPFAVYSWLCAQMQGAHCLPAGRPAARAAVRPVEEH
jgi:hypothetical protein